ncbi:MAG TPA: hypothetical protein VIM25_11920 [Candidatus Limnocylindrales bacterium]
MAMVDRAAIGRGDEFDDLPSVERPIDGVERPGLRGALLGDRVGDLAQRRPNAVDAREIARPLCLLGGSLGANTIRAFGVDDASVDEPGERGVERRELFDRETILGVIGVQEVEGVLEIDVVGVAAIGRIRCVDVHGNNHLKLIDRLRARGYSDNR